MGLLRVQKRNQKSSWWYNMNGQMTRRGSVSMESVTITQDAIDDASTQIPSLHDIKMKFDTIQLHKNALGRGEIKNTRNSGIFAKMVLRKNVIAKISIYPSTTTIDISRTMEPLVYNSRGAQELIGHAERIRDHLYNNFGAEDMPDSLDWIVTQYHLNQDGKMKLSDNNYHRTLEDVTGGFIREYAKRFQDGIRFRAERITTPNCTMKAQIQDMLNVGNYLDSDNHDISHIMPSQILALNAFARIVCKMSQTYNPSHHGVLAF